MARVNVYLPDDLADEVKKAGINVSNVVQHALRDRLQATGTDGWLDSLRSLPETGITHEQVIHALDAVRADQGDDWPEPAPAETG